MAFWRKSIELPDAFYQAAGESALCVVESHTMAEKLKSSSMTFDQACELLDLVRKGFVRLRALIAEYPIKSDTSLEMRDSMCEDSIRDCEERTKAILALSDVDRSSPLCRYGADIDGLDVAHFERSITNMSDWLGSQQVMVLKEMAKGANTNSNDLLSRAVQEIKNTPRRKLVLSKAFPNSQCP
jgi:hypothetical protein